jgi:hypothetical protein
MKWLVSSLLFVFAFADGVLASSQPDSLIAVLKYNPQYIRVFKDKLNISNFFSIRSANLTIKNRDDQEQTVNYNPNSFVNLGLGFNYGWLSIESDIRIPFVDQRDPLKGNTKVFHIGANFIRRKYWFKGFVHVTKGYYLDNVKAFDPTWFDRTQNYYFRDDIQTTVYYLSGNYLFNNKKFSYKASINQFEQQKKTAGSFIIGGTLTYFGASADTSLLPLNAKKGFSPYSDVNNSKVLHLGLNFGYLFTLVIKKRFFVHLGVMPSAGIKYYRYSNDSANTYKEDAGLGYLVDGRFCAGYSNEKIYCGVAFNWISLNDNVNGQGVMQLGESYVRIFYGMRFVDLPFGGKWATLLQ